MRLETITPERAAELLAMNYEDQRPINYGSVRRLTEAMRQGEWVAEIAGPVVVSDTGKLIDGQHRLTAVIHAGEPVDMYVAEGVKESDFTKIDSGVSRTVGNTLPFGTRNRTIVASLMKYVTNYKRNGLNDDTMRDRPLSYEPRREYDIAPAYYDRIAADAKAVYDCYKVGSAAAIAFAIFLANEVDPDKADEFVTALKGEGPNGWMYRVLNKWYVGQTSATLHTVRKEAAIRVLARLWRCLIDGEELSRLQVKLSAPIGFKGIDN